MLKIILKQIEQVTNTSYRHYFAKYSQWTFVSEKHYKAIQKLANGKYFKREYSSLKREYDKRKYERNAYFNNTHESMTEVWQASSVISDERNNHATPKPIELMQRVMNSSLKKGGLCVEPFGGSGSTLIGAEKTGRKCYTMELDKQYCDTIIKRWQKYTGKQAIHADTLIKYDDVK